MFIEILPLLWAMKIEIKNSYNIFNILMNSGLILKSVMEWG